MDGAVVPTEGAALRGQCRSRDLRALRLGYVELDGKLLVESRLTVADPEQLVIGMELELVVEPLFINERDEEVVTFAFAPVATSQKPSES